MGERLNIEIVKGSKLLANAYYHWSGYTTSAINLTLEIIQSFDYIKNNKVENVKERDLLFAIRLLEETGAGLLERNIGMGLRKVGLLVDKDITFKICKGRNEGIISISEEEMEDTRSWEEERVTIDIENQTINFQAFHEIDKSDIDDYKDEGISFKEININFNNIRFEDAFDLKSFIDKSEYLGEYYFYNKFDGSYIGLIA